MTRLLAWIAYALMFGTFSVLLFPRRVRRWVRNTDRHRGAPVSWAPDE